MKLKYTFRLLAVILAVLMVFPALPIFAEGEGTSPDEQTEQTQEQDNGLKLIRMPKAEEQAPAEMTTVASSEIIGEGEETASVGGGARSVTQTFLPDGVYAFRNVVNDMYIDIRADSTSPGAFMQQYVYTESPANTGGTIGLYQIIRQGTGNLYKINPMLNTDLTFGMASVPGGYVKTKNATSSDLFEIIYNGESCTIRFADEEDGYISGPYNTASGSAGAPQSNLLVNSLNGRSHWVPENVVRSGVFALRDSNGLYMDIAQSKTVPGYNVQQYNYGSAAGVDDMSGLWEIAETSTPGLYVIRAFLVNTLSFSATSGQWLTRTVAEQDADLEAEDLFWIEYTTQGYTIRENKTNGQYVCAPIGTASGLAGAPNSYLVAQSSGSSAQAKWQFERRLDMIPNGVYSFQNFADPDMWMDTRNDSTDPGAFLQQYTYGRDPRDQFDRGGLFKVTRVWGADHRYLIRLMTDNRLSIETDGEKFVTYEIETDDDNVGIASDFYIYYSEGGYVFQQYGYSGSYITAPEGSASGAAGGDASKLLAQTLTEGGSRARWKPYKYTGTERAGHTFSFSSEILVAGTELRTRYETWSTAQNINTPRVSLPDSAITSVSWNSSDIFVLTPHNSGLFSITFAICRGNEPYYTFEYEFEVILPLHEGAYYFRMYDYTIEISNSDEVTQSIQYNYCMQYDDNKSASTNGAHLELHKFEDREDQRWELTHVGDGYYSIRSVESDLAVAVQENHVDDDEYKLIQETYDATSDRQHWKVENVEGGTFKISPRSANNSVYDWVMAAGDAIFNRFEPGQNVEQREYEDEYKFHWKLVPCGEIPLLPQDESVWCWAASVLMLSQAFVDLEMTQDELVYAVTGIENKGQRKLIGGNTDRIMRGLAECLSLVLDEHYNATNEDRLWDVHFIESEISQSSLVSLLKDGNPVIYGGHSLFEGISGHAMVICDYFWEVSTQQYMFWVYDPWEIGKGDIYAYRYETLLNGNLYQDNKIDDFLQYNWGKSYWVSER